MTDIIILNIEFEYEGSKHSINPVILMGDKDVILIDCGYPGFMGLIEEEMKNKRVNPKDLTGIYLTHQDDDHMGTAYDFKKKYPNIKIIASSKETPYIDGRYKNLRLTQAEDLLELLPEEQKSFGISFCNRLRELKPVCVDMEVKEGDSFDWAGGCTVIETPGHMPGHTSLYIEDEKILITGDAAVIEEGQLILANPQFCIDLKEAEASLKKIQEMDVHQFICYHGGILFK